jgi:hypothetical protein
MTRNNPDRTGADEICTGCGMHKRSWKGNKRDIAVVTVLKKIWTARAVYRHL